jgi:hypothetical protein
MNTSRLQSPSTNAKITFMTKLILAGLLLCSLNYSCSKKDHAEAAPPAGQPILQQAVRTIEYPIDLDFTKQSTLFIYSDSTDPYPYFREQDFEFHAVSDSNLPNDSSGSIVAILQNYSYFTKTYSAPEIIVTANAENRSNFFRIVPDSVFNVFNLAYQNGSVSFSGTCHAVPDPQSKKYETITSVKSQPLYFSGSFDSSNHTGNIKIKGSVYLSN